MTRDELILSCQPIVNNLVKKYNNHQPDEDLQSVGMIAVIECVDRCLKEEMDDIDQIQARCNLWAKNRILTEIYKEKPKISDDELIDVVESEESDVELLLYLEQVLTPRQKEIFDLLLQGYSPDEIGEKLNIQKRTMRDHMKHIKEKIKN